MSILENSHKRMSSNENSETAIFCEILLHIRWYFSQISVIKIELLTGEKVINLDKKVIQRWFFVNHLTAGGKFSFYITMVKGITEVKDWLLFMSLKINTALRNASNIKSLTAFATDLQSLGGEKLRQMFEGCICIETHVLIELS